MPANTVAPGLLHRLTEEQGLAPFVRRITEAKAASRQLHPSGFGYVTPQASWVYFIAATPGDFIKIGWSVNPVQRLTDLQTILPPGVDLRLVAIIRGGYNDELALHRRFAHLRVRNEWFRPSTEIHDYIRGRAELVADRVLASLAQGDAAPSQDNEKTA